ncbi:MAG: transketolase [Dissulfuribacterales bacterium]
MIHVDMEQQVNLTSEQLEGFQAMWKRCATRILLSTSLAASGHPGGSLSSLHSLIILYAVMRHRPDMPDWEDRDRLVMSIGHVSPAVYSVLVEYGYLSEERFLMEFRRAGSPCAGHVEIAVPGVEWNTGNLGQGLSVGTGFAKAMQFAHKDCRTIVFMGDGEQQKGQIAEARRFASKYGQKNLIAIIDRNHLQIGGVTEDVMPVRVQEEYEAAGWNVVYVPDGNDFQLVYRGLRRAWYRDYMEPDRPTVVVMRTTMGKGISFMEDKAKYHGSTLSKDALVSALQEIGADVSLVETWDTRRKAHVVVPFHRDLTAPYPAIEMGESILYEADVKTDCRSAYGNALKDIAERNNLSGKPPKVVGVSCDLEGSVKMDGLRKVSPQAFIECGIQEHHAAVLAGALSRCGFVTFFSTFGVFAVAEVYNQQRLNDLNQTNVKVVATHLGLDVGEDGPTHQSIDYLGLLNNLLGFSIFMPADANQTDRIIRYVAKQPGNVFVGMGRSKFPTILNDKGEPFYGKDYVFRPGKAELLRQGEQATILTYGSILFEVLKAEAFLRGQGVNVSVLNMASIKPMDVDAVISAAKRGPIITVEDHLVATGLGSMVAGVLVNNNVLQRCLMLGVTKYGSSGAPIDLYREQGLNAEGIAASVQNFIK